MLGDWILFWIEHYRKPEWPSIIAIQYQKVPEKAPEPERGKWRRHYDEIARRSRNREKR